MTKQCLEEERVNQKKGVAQHGLHRKANSARDNDRKDGRERGGDMQPEVAGRPQHIAH